MGLEEEMLDKYFLNYLCQGMQYAEFSFFHFFFILSFVLIVLWYMRKSLKLKDGETYLRSFLCGQILVSCQNILVNIGEWKVLGI